MKKKAMSYRWGVILIVLCFITACDQNQGNIENGTAQSVSEAVQPVIVTDAVQNDSDDPAIWVHPTNPEKSLVIGTDKNDPGALYVFDLAGNILRDKVVKNLRRPNNVDVEYGLVLNGSPVDIAVTAERLMHRIRIFRLPDMAPVDNGGIEVFIGEQPEEFRETMGIALYKRPGDGAVFAIVGRKNGPGTGYLWQYLLSDDGTGQVKAELVRKFGAFCGEGEIEAIAVDDALGYVYYSDEQAGIRKYHADPDMGDDQLAFFGVNDFTEDREGISIYAKNDRDGFIIVSDQQANSFNIYNRQGPSTDPHSHKLLKKVKVAAVESDGSEVCPIALNDTFRYGLFVAMSDNKTFHYYRWEDIVGDIIK